MTFSYTLTPAIKQTLAHIDRLYQGILLTPLPPQSEHILRWLAFKDRVYGAFHLGGLPITKSGLEHVIGSPVRNPTDDERRILAYKKALEVIYHEWTATPTHLERSHIGAVSIIAMPMQAKRIVQLLQRMQSDLKQLTSYVSTQKDHPLISSAVVYGQLMQTDLGALSQGRIPHLLYTLLMAKYGYDCRGMLTLEPQWLASSADYSTALESITRYGQLTLWLEYMVKSAYTQFQTLHQTVRQISEGQKPNLSVTSWRLNTRQEQILRELAHPAAKITNRDIKQLFRISQVTASRDLSHLAGLGLLYAHGKGRSVYYTKA